MSQNRTNPYDLEAHLAEIYDQTETDLEDVALIRRLIGAGRTLRILEPFCGTGRICLPLALDGHTLVGLDQAGTMLDQARQKIGKLPRAVQNRIHLQRLDVVSDDWPDGFDLVILGGNCFYELATPEEQETCIRLAALALKPGGWAYIDNDHMEGQLDEAWQKPGRHQLATVGVCADGATVEGSRETIWYDAPRRLVRFRRWTRIIQPDGTSLEREFIQQKHPVSAMEVRGWLEKYGFTIGQVYGDHSGQPYADESQRAIFWAQKRLTALD